MIELLFAMAGVIFGFGICAFLTASKIAEYEASEAENLRFIQGHAETWRKENAQLRAENRLLKISGACGHHQDDIHEDLPRFVQ